MLALRRFQTRFIRAATAPDFDTAAMSCPRGNGKSALAGHLLTRVMSPSDALFRPGTESVLCAASIEQARIVFRFARADLEPTGEYRFLDSHTRIGITHKASNTRLRVIGSNGKTAMGLVGCPWAVCDEPGAWETKGGELLYDAIETAKGKPGSPLKALYIGTLAPALSGWWHDLVAGGTRGSVYVQSLQGDPERWDRWPEIRRCNPLSNIDAKFRRKLLEERDEARRDTRLKARFLSYRLNLPTPDENQVLLTVEDWKRVRARPEGLPTGRPVVGVDLGFSRAWSAAVAAWPTGRLEAVAVAPGIPGIDEQERRDRVPRGTYRRLVDAGLLVVAHGLRVPPPSMLVAAVKSRWRHPRLIVCDRFRVEELHDANPPCRIEPRVTRWSDSTADIRAMRRMAADGPLSVDRASERLLAASLAVATVKVEEGNVRLVKRDHNNTARDDVAAALILAVGAIDRSPAPRVPRIRVVA